MRLNPFKREVPVEPWSLEVLLWSAALASTDFVYKPRTDVWLDLINNGRDSQSNTACVGRVVDIVDRSDTAMLMDNVSDALKHHSNGDLETIRWSADNGDLEAWGAKIASATRCVEGLLVYPRPV
jgi:hypothetical protein